MNQRFYRGKNGQDYLNELDAEIYGGGLVTEITHMGTVERRVSLTKDQKEEVRKKKEANAEVTYSLYGEFTPPTDNEEFVPIDVVEASPEEQKAAEEDLIAAMNAREEEKSIIKNPVAKKPGRPVGKNK